MQRFSCSNSRSIAVAAGLAAALAACSDNKVTTPVLPTAYEEVKLVADASGLYSDAKGTQYRLLTLSPSEQFSRILRAEAYRRRGLRHADTRMTEKHYAHLGPNSVAQPLRANFPVLGLTDGADVVPLRRVKKA